MNGFDCYGPVTAEQAARAKSAGMTFCGRYYGSGAKLLLPPEVIILAEAGLAILSYFERSSSRALSGRGAGLSDGALALHQARTAGQPTGSAIYFAVDFDAALSAHSMIADYFAGVRAGLGLDYRVGVYGSGSVCRALLSREIVSVTALAGADGWRGSQGFASWQVKQYPTVSGGPLGIDYDPLECPDLEKAGIWSPKAPIARRPILRPGDKGDDVVALQRKLSGAGFDPGSDDGVFGPRTEAAFWSWAWAALA